jgi:hypothetical protein
MVLEEAVPGAAAIAWIPLLMLECADELLAGGVRMK